MTPMILTPKNAKQSSYGVVDHEEMTVYTKFGVIDFPEQTQFDIFLEHNQAKECDLVPENFKFFVL